MLSVRADFPVDWPHANIYTLADLHIGDAHCDESEVLARVKAAADDPYGLVILNGDLMNTALKTSVSDVYGEILSPMQQISHLVTMLRPIADKIIGVTAGNHENRVYRNDGIDVTRLVCRELGIEEKYAPEGVLIFLRFGPRRTPSTSKKVEIPVSGIRSMRPTEAAAAGKRAQRRSVWPTWLASLMLMCTSTAIPICP